MKIPLIVFFFIVKTFISVGQDLHDKIDTSKLTLDSQFSEKSKLIVRNFTSLLIKNGNIDSLLDNCSVPFVIDGKEISKRDELKKLFMEAMAAVSKTSNKLEVDSTYIFGSRNEILNGLIPIHVYFVVCEINIYVAGQTAKKQSIYAVQVGDTPKIIGATFE